MHLLTIMAFAMLFWRSEQAPEWVLVGEHDVIASLVIVLVQPPLLAVSAWLAARRAIRLLTERPDNPQVAQQYHHRATAVLRGATILGFAVSVLLTRWPDWFALGAITPALQIVGDLIVLSPFLAGVIVVWLAAYPLERALREQSLGYGDIDAAEKAHPFRLRSYLSFNLRHHVLVIAAPLTLILLAADLLRGYERSLQVWTKWAWTPDILLGVVALGVFIAAPVMLARIWKTVPLEEGPVRERLEALCERIGLRCRDILAWHSDGMMINAAVMGVFAPVRYVLLSDGLLATMSVTQIGAVFGHETGHIRHHHMQHFLLFAFVGWLFVVGVMEFLARATATPVQALTTSSAAIQGVGLGATIIVWGVGFGWLSRRFERQADRFGAWCVTPPPARCKLPCSVHVGDQTVLETDGRVCATGVAVFTSALERVASLNGIPREERSWRHSSVASRIRFLTSLAGDPSRAERFERLIHRLKTGLLTAAIIGTAFCVYYWTVVPEPAILRLQAGAP